MSEQEVPSWLPPLVAAHVLWQLRERPDDAALRSLAFDPRMQRFWLHVGPRLRLTMDEISLLLGSILGPLSRYKNAGTRDRPNLKVRLRDRQKTADELLDRAAGAAADLAILLEDLESLTRYLPDEMRLLTLVRRATGMDLDEVDSYDEGAKTAAALHRLAQALAEHPRTEGLFLEIPGMASQKASWRDWLVEVLTNLGEFERQQGVRLELREAHWVALAQVLVSPDIGRASVNSALRSFSADKRKK